MQQPRKHPLYVTRPIAPDDQVLHQLQKGIIERGFYSNFGPLEQELSSTLGARFGSNKVLLFNNGTIALLTLLLSLERRTGTFLTSPFTFPATVHCIRLAGYDVKFVDIDPATLNIDPTKLAESIDENTVGVLAVHVYGNPCEIDKIHHFCQINNLYEIYDAAHCFDVYENGRAVYQNGLASVASLHATKLMHTGEGGAIFFREGDLLRTTKSMMNFGIQGEDTVHGIGLNGKLSEFNAAVGLSVLPSVSGEIALRRSIAEMYTNALSKIEGVSFPLFRKSVERNFQYYPVILDSRVGVDRDVIWSKLRSRNIFARKYFYPLISDCWPYTATADGQKFPNAEFASRNVICLPMYSGVTPEDVAEIVSIISAVKEESN